MMDTANVLLGPAALATIGGPTLGREWVRGEPDYAAVYGLDGTDVPRLIDMALRWASETFSDEVAGWAPVYAWRALGQMRAVEAVAPLLGILDALDEGGDHWFLEEFPYVFGLIGSPGAALLAAYLGDPAHRVYARIAVAHGVQEIAHQHEDARDSSVGILAEALRDFDRTDPQLNGFLVSYLLRLGAVESAETIDRAFAAGCVDESIVGHWGSVRRELGVEGMGLAVDGPTQPGLSERLGLDRAFRNAAGGHASGSNHSTSSGHGSSRNKNRAKRKAQRGERKRNRERR